MVIEERNELDESFFRLNNQILAELESVLGSDEWAALKAKDPGFNRLGHGDQSRTPVPNADPNAPVIYLQGPGDKGGVVYTGHGEDEP